MQRAVDVVATGANNAALRDAAATAATLLLLGGPWEVINGVISRVTLLITHIRGLITPLVTTHEPPSGV